jgi:hypothetical protein
MKESEIVLCCVPYVVQEHEGLIIFSERSGFYGVHQRIEFRKKNDCWYLSLYKNLPTQEFMFAHILAAHKWSVEHYGKDHAAGRGEG